MSILLIKTLKDTENMALSKRKLEEALEETCTERDKALQELARLKQHILEKVMFSFLFFLEDDKTLGLYLRK